jgi:hypothetical protein
MNNTQINKLTLKCTVTGELVTYRGWDYISKRIEKAGSLELLEKTFRSKKGKRVGSASASTEFVKVKQTKEQSVASFNKPKGDQRPATKPASWMESTSYPKTVKNTLRLSLNLEVFLAPIGNQSLRQIVVIYFYPEFSTIIL